MSERKVLNKYYPPEFDPSKIPRRKAPKNDQQKIRLMAPFNMRCATCGEYIYKGKKFNARKEIAAGEEYLGIKAYRFYIRCPMCAAEITFKTDVKAKDYVAEHGAVRNYDPQREEEQLNSALDEADQADQALNPVLQLEEQAARSRREVQMLDALDEMRTQNARLERASAALGAPPERGRSDELDYEHDDEMQAALAEFRAQQAEQRDRALAGESISGGSGTLAGGPARRRPAAPKALQPGRDTRAVAKPAEPAAETAVLPAGTAAIRDSVRAAITQAPAAGRPRRAAVALLGDDSD